MSGRAGADEVTALRQRAESNPDDLPARLRLAALLATRGEREAARALLAPLEDQEGPIGCEAAALLAGIDEAEGHLAAALARWERLLADDIDHREARAHHARLRAARDPDLALPRQPASGAPTLASPEGVTVLRYEIVREIGRGATATVYLARDRALGLPVALKVLHAHLATSERSQACRRFFAEARTIAALRHPGVVAIHDLDEAARALVMEPLPGGSVRDRMRAAGRLPPEEVSGMARTLLSALTYVHARGIVHGDITPRNIMLRRPGEAVLADFGNARLFGTGGAGSEQTAGTPLYLAPEQFRGALSSPSTDLFAVGATLWEALVGRPMRAHADLLAERVVAPGLPEPARALEHAPLTRLVHALTSPAPERPPDAAAALRLLDG